MTSRIPKPEPDQHKIKPATSQSEFEPHVFVRWFRCAAPYIHAFRGHTFVVAFGGEVVKDGKFVELVHDLNLLNSLGVRLVLVHGTRPQIEERLRDRNAELAYVGGLRVTDDTALACVKDAAGSVRVEIEALLSMGLANSPMAGAAIRVASGNFVTAKPLGIRDGVDLGHTGEVRKIDAVGITQRLAQGEIVLLSPLGYSPTGETFNLTLEDVASSTAIALKAKKLIFLMENEGVPGAGNKIVSELSDTEAENILSRKPLLPEDIQLYLPGAVTACRNGVDRVHLLSRHIDGAILQELFTHGGVGSMIAMKRIETLRAATIEDVGGILRVIEPLEADGVLVRRNRERLEMEIGRFSVLEYDGMIAGCVALYPFAEEGLAELACLAVHPAYRNAGRGDALLQHIEELARQQGIRRLFVLTTHTAHWFIERGFSPAGIEQLPAKKQGLYNYQRRSKVFMKGLS